MKHKKEEEKMQASDASEYISKNLFIKTQKFKIPRHVPPRFIQKQKAVSIDSRPNSFLTNLLPTRSSLGLLRGWRSRDHFVVGLLVLRISDKVRQRALAVLVFVILVLLK